MYASLELKMRCVGLVLCTLLLSVYLARAEVNRKWLNPIRFPTRTGQNVEISLSKKEFAEDCYILKPDGDNVKTTDANIEGVRAYDSSDYVSCRISIGPMDESLLGDWALCGKRTDNNEEPDRCQLTTITWRNEGNPSQEWSITRQDEFDHPVHLGGTWYPAVGNGNTRVSCHIITPNGEDLVIHADSDYPHLKLVTTGNSICSIAIGPITNQMLKNWTIYGMFTGKRGLSEAHLPMNFFLYDEENPYNQAYNVTRLSPIIRAVNLLTSPELEVTSSGTVDQCLMETPSGDVVEHYERASFVDVNGRIACRLAIGPITEQLLGSWTVIGKFGRNGLFTEIRQTTKIIQEDPANPILEEDRAVEVLNSQHVETDMGSSHSILISNTKAVTQSCHVLTPDGLQYQIMDGFSLPGVTVVEGSNIQCGIIVNVKSEKQIGTWTLIARTLLKNVRRERRLPFTISVEDTSTVSVQTISVDAGEDATFNVRGYTPNVTACELVTPTNEVLRFKHDEPSAHGERYVLGEANPSIPCSVTIKNAQASDSGVWTLSLENEDGVGDPESYRLTVTDATEETGDPAEVNKKWLNPIRFPTRTGQNVEISLSKKEFAEDCYILKPNGENVKTTDANIKGVRAHDSSDYVSCRISIGPMDESLLGDWALCGKRTDNNEEPDRCQLTTISWRNEGNPSQEWSITRQDEFDHPVHLGGTWYPAVGNGNTRVSCHIITPNGEDLVIHADSDYPHLKLVTTGNSICSIAIGPITNQMLKNWTIYGMFTGKRGLSEAHLPMNFFLYDEENPYNQAYNVTRLSPIIRAVNLRTRPELEVTSSGTVDQCLMETPSGDVVKHYEGASFVDVNGRIACRLAIGSITEQLLGSWTVIGKFSRNGIFTEIRQTTKIIQEDPANPILEEDRAVEVLNAQHVETDMGSSHSILINNTKAVTQSCHVLTPDGLQYQIMDGFILPGVTVVEGSNIQCGIIVNVESEKQIGTWTLIARTLLKNVRRERRLPFTISVEEIVEAVPKAITVLEGNSVHVRLANPTAQYDTCELHQPDGSVSSHAVDPLNIQRCGFVISNVSMADKGTWAIVFGNSRKIHRAPIVVNIDAMSAGSDSSFSTNIDLIGDQDVDMIVGPADAIYCRLVDPNGVPVFDGFGPCRMTLGRVTQEHFGAWQMTVASSGRVIAVEHQIYVNVRESEGRPLVSTNVVTDKPIVTLTCGVAVDATVRSCKFRDPQGRILLSTGVIEERYTSNGVQTSIVSQISSHECGLQITNPEASDLGLWRCAFDTEEDTYYGFLKVICPWAIQVPEIAAVVQQEPILKAHSTELDAVENEPVTMSCAVDAAIKYCYFRFQNGTIFTVSPGAAGGNSASARHHSHLEPASPSGRAMSSRDMEYVGAGFDAGECGIRFQSMKHRDSGRWSCHVGLVSDPEEQRVNIRLTVSEAMRTDHRRDYYPIMVVEGLVHGGRVLDYCRFVRIDGFGFITGNVPSTYVDTSSISHGICQLTVNNPTILDLHPWTIVAKIRGQDHEISRDTMDSLVLAISTPEGEENGDVMEQINARRISPFGIFFYVVLSVFLVAILLGVWLGPRRNREWTYARAASLRTSFRRSSIRKKPLQKQEPPKYEP